MMGRFLGLPLFCFTISRSLLIHSFEDEENKEDFDVALDDLDVLGEVTAVVPFGE
jgi:hypothetical protein